MELSPITGQLIANVAERRLQIETVQLCRGYAFVEHQVPNLLAKVATGVNDGRT